VVSGMGYQFVLTEWTIVFDILDLMKGFLSADKSPNALFHMPNTLAWVDI